MVGERVMWQVFLPALLSVSYLQCCILIFMYMMLLADKRAKPENLPKCSALTEIWEHWNER
jgi:hypothetical protein